MNSTLTWLGHGCFQLDTAGKSVLIDPFFTGNPAAATSAEAVAPDFIVLTHGHGDHVGDTVAIARRTGALVIANYEITEWLSKQGVSRVHAQNTGGGYAHPFGRLKFTIAQPRMPTPGLRGSGRRPRRNRSSCDLGKFKRSEIPARSASE